jgi:dienelactone hydrolase
MHKALAIFAVALAFSAFAGADTAHAELVPERVTFPSADGKTTLVGYLYQPAAARGASPAHRPAVVMMHGRSGAYSSLAKGVYNASTLSRRHKAWGELWAEHGFIALMVDGFGPRGFPAGFDHDSYAKRPESVNEVTVRPLDAYGALAWLRARPDVDGAHVGLQGWSNGGSATLAAMAETRPRPKNMQGFAAALAFYPGCGLKGAFEDGYKPYASLHILIGSADEEVSPKLCTQLVEASYSRGGKITLYTYDGASHNFDDPSTVHQKVEANAKATEDAKKRSVAFFEGLLKPKSPLPAPATNSK